MQPADGPRAPASPRPTHSCFGMRPSPLPEILVPKVRFELTRPCGPRILSPPRLPFRHFGMWL